MKKIRAIISVLLICFLALGACAAESNITVGVRTSQPSITANQPVAATQNNAPSPSELNIVSIEADPDPSVDAADLKDPYTAVSKYDKEIGPIDRELYNALFKAALAKEKNLDISSFDLDKKVKVSTAGSLLGESGYHLFFLKNVKVSSDGKTVKFIYYNMSGKDIEKGREAFDARLSQLIYNTAPYGTYLQKFISLYTYISETSDYTGDMSDQTTFSPYSILVKKEGICGGFALLFKYALDKAGIESEYVCQMAHAWDIVKLNGKWYQTDPTWGAGGSKDPFNYVKYMLMDDAERKASLKDSGIPEESIIIGYPCGKGTPPPKCTDDTFGAYCGLKLSYAFDIEGGKVYYCDTGSIGSMNLDCTDKQTILEGDSCAQMYFFNGYIYYNSANDGSICRLKPGGKPEVLVGPGSWYFLKGEGTKLKYAADTSLSDAKTIELLPLPNETKNAKIIKEDSVSCTRSFSFKIKFSQPMDEKQDWNKAVYLTDDKGNTIPLSFKLEGDGMALTVRPKECVADFSYVTLYVTTAAAAKSGGKIGQCCGMKVDIKSGEQ